MLLLKASAAQNCDSHFSLTSMSLLSDMFLMFLLQLSRELGETGVIPSKGKKL